MGMVRKQHQDKDLEKVMFWIDQERRHHLLNLTLTAIGTSVLMVIVVKVMPYFDDESEPVEDNIPVAQILGMDWTTVVSIGLVAGFVLYWLFKDRKIDRRQLAQAEDQSESMDSEDESARSLIIGLGPRIIFGIIPYAIFYLSLMNKIRRRRTAIILISLFRMCGEPLDIESMDIEGLECDVKMAMLLKLKSMGWVYVSKDLKTAVLESDIEQSLIHYLGYRR